MVAALLGLLGLATAGAGKSFFQQMMEDQRRTEAGERFSGILADSRLAGDPMTPDILGKLDSGLFGENLLRAGDDRGFNFLRDSFQAGQASDVADMSNRRGIDAASLAFERSGELQDDRQAHSFDLLGAQTQAKIQEEGRLLARRDAGLQIAMRADPDQIGQAQFNLATSQALGSPQPGFEYRVQGKDSKGRNLVTAAPMPGTQQWTSAMKERGSMGSMVRSINEIDRITEGGRNTESIGANKGRLDSLATQLIFGFKEMTAAGALDQGLIDVLENIVPDFTEFSGDLTGTQFGRLIELREMIHFQAQQLDARTGFYRGSKPLGEVNVEQIMAERRGLKKISEKPAVAPEQMNSAPQQMIEAPKKRISFAEFKRLNRGGTLAQYEEFLSRGQ